MKELKKFREYLSENQNKELNVFSPTMDVTSTTNELNESIKQFQKLAGIIKEEITNQLNSDQLIEKLRIELDGIREKYNGKLTRNTIKDEFNYQIGKI
jgi:hypothetical protein